MNTPLKNGFDKETVDTLKLIVEKRHCARSTGFSCVIPLRTAWFREKRCCSVKVPYQRMTIGFVVPHAADAACRSERVFDGREDQIRRQGIHACILRIAARATEEAVTLLCGRHDTSASIQFELVRIEDVVHEHDPFPKADGDMQGKRHRRDDGMAAVHERDEVAHGKETVVHGAAGCRKLRIEFMFLLAAQQ
jgi:hypothetical protein